MDDEEIKKEIEKLIRETWQYFNNKEYEKAIEIIKKVIALDPKNDKHFSNIGNCYCFLKRYDEAHESHIKAIELAKNNTNKHSRLIGLIYAYVGIADVYLNTGKYEDAIMNCDEALKIDAESEVAHSSKAMINIKQEKYKDAIDSLKIIIEKYKSKSNAYTVITLHILFVICEILSKTKEYTDDLHNLIKDIINIDIKGSKLYSDILLLGGSMNHIQETKIDTLFKYRKYNERALENIINGTLTLSDYNYFNDPADPPIKLKKDIFKDIKLITDEIKIASLAIQNDNILMWSHYTDSHKGICIGYDLSTLDREKYILKKGLYQIT